MSAYAAAGGQTSLGKPRVARLLAVGWRSHKSLIMPRRPLKPHRMFEGFLLLRDPAASGWATRSVSDWNRLLETEMYLGSPPPVLAILSPTFSGLGSSAIPWPGD